MPRYIRAKIDGGTFFFTVTLADRSSNLLLQHIVLLRRAHRSVRDHHPFETVAICILPDHLHAICVYPRAIRIFHCAGISSKAASRVLSQTSHRDHRVRLPNVRRGFGSGGTGSMSFETTMTWSVTSITSTSIL